MSHKEAVLSYSTPTTCGESWIRKEWARPRGRVIEEISADAARELIDNYRGKPPSENLYYCKGDGCFIGIDNTTGNCWTEEFQTLSQCRRWLRGEIEVG